MIVYKSNLRNLGSVNTPYSERFGPVPRCSLFRGFTVYEYVAEEDNSPVISYTISFKGRTRQSVILSRCIFIHFAQTFLTCNSSIFFAEIMLQNQRKSCSYQQI